MVVAQIFLYGCLAMLAGVGLASLVGVSYFLLWLAAAIAAVLFFAGIAIRNRKVAVAGIMLAGFILGFWRFESVWRYAQDSQLAKLNGKTAEINGIIVGDPVLGQANQQIILEPGGIDGKILVIANRYPEYRYGDRIKFAAGLEAPRNSDGFDYQNYLAKDGIYSMARYPKIELISQNNGNLVYSGLLSIKRKLKEGIGRVLPAPHNSLLIAILLGDQSGLAGCSAKELEADPDCVKLKEKLNISGLRHLAAVSGTHIAIMAGIIAPLLVALGWWRQKALWATLVFVWAFVAMIGFPASAVRAGIMGGLMILAQIIGRLADTARIVTIAAVFMVLQNPLVLRFDIGFQLSFLAVLGMAYFAKPIERRADFISKWARQPLATTLAAEIFTLPLLIYNFGYVPFYAPITNLLVEPIVFFVTVYGFIMAIAAAINSVLGWLLFFPMWLALSYLLGAAEFFSALPYAAINFQIDFIWLAVSYVFLAVAAWRAKENEKQDFLK